MRRDDLNYSPDARWWGPPL